MEAVGGEEPVKDAKMCATLLTPVRCIKRGLSDVP